jgi:DNA-binding GntR family transcriptional regulator
VYERLKTMIYNRELKPGDRLVQMTLAKRLGTSAMPVIEALRRLESDGLAVHVPQLGSFVKEATVEDICELYCIRRGLEAEACLLFVDNATPAEVTRLRELDTEFNEAAEAGKLEQMLQADMNLHQHIVAATKVNRLQEFFERNQIEERVFSQAPELRSNTRKLSRFVGFHKAVVEALARRDGPAAAAAMREHILAAERDYVASARETEK